MTQLRLSAEQRRACRAQAHHLQPVVLMGRQGLTPSLRQEADQALAAHGLIKIRLLEDDRSVRRQLFESLADELNAAPVQLIGKLAVLWRPIPEKEKIADGQRGRGPHTDKVVKNSRRGGRPPQVRHVRVLGNERISPGGKLKRRRSTQKSVKKGRS